MGTKENPAAFDCYGNAEPDEPMFILLARDPSAPDIVEKWAIRRAILISTGQKPESDRAMVDEARECANAMRVWRYMRETRKLGPGRPVPHHGSGPDNQ